MFPISLLENIFLGLIEVLSYKKATVKDIQKYFLQTGLCTKQNGYIYKRKQLCQRYSRTFFSDGLKHLVKWLHLQGLQLCQKHMFPP